ncbi:mitochondrial carrier domain-containing protein [Fomes fomentarius]|nr:mitochondrial carrier domain-containing protein [Fomes fomentarius]
MRLIYSEGSSLSLLAPPSAHGVPANPSPQLFARFPILNFYRGFSVSIAGMIPYAGTSFLVWGYLRASILPPRPGNASSKSKSPSKPVSDLAFGAVAGAFAQTVSYPFEVVRRRMQVGGITRPDRWLRWGEIVGMIWSTWGWRGFFVGLSIGYLKVVPMTAVNFTVWQALRPMLGI